MTVDQEIQAVIIREGDYSNHPADRGGPTRWGVTEQVARAYGYAGDMRILPQSTAAQIYRRQYWTDVLFDQVALRYARVGSELFDTGINMGQEIAGGFLQRALNLLNAGATLWPDLKVDGRIGAVTLAALDSYKQRRGIGGEAVLLKVLDGFQVARYADITEARPANEAFFYGWIANRIGQAA
ncbi:glycosyl hydrolase 108 family protein [Sphingomonas sp. GV3]|uniref:glycoside hydrolase family 108 protein n=1 Tax=Sphingomonas sp. GV3 TaxID=3040671 RepID=UPI00280BA218|nr:glycosyl hydrolase 108 family protein [Sphingomonas sp. GV3]